MKMKRRLRDVLPFAFAVCLLLPTAARPADLHFSSETLLRVFERDTSTKEDVQVVPAYEYLQLDAGALRTKGLSFHIYGWGRADLGDGDYFEDDTAGELLYGYAEYTQPFSNLNLKLGRFYVFEGVANESVDGVRLSSDVTPYFTVSAYGGQPVALDSHHGRSGDSLWGGRLAHHLGSLYEIGLSYKKVDDDGDVADERIGGDLSVSLPLGASLYGFSSYNTETSGWAEHTYELRFSVADLQLSPFYQRFEYEDYFGAGAQTRNPFVFLHDTDETLDVFGAEVSLPVAGSVDLGARYKHYEYDLRDDASDFYALQATWHGARMTQVGGEFGYMDGDTAENEYLLGRAFFYADGLFARGFVSGDLVYVDYNESIFGEDTALFASLGLGRSFLDERLELKLSGDFSQDPYFDEDWRGMLVAKYVYDR